MYVIRGVVEEKDVLKLGEVLFGRLSACCTKLVLIDVKRYLASKDKNPECAKIVEAVFASQLFLSNVVKDEELMEAIRVAEAIQYDHISAEVPTEELKHYYDCLNKVKACEYSQPYRAAITSSYIKDILNAYKEAGFKDIAKRIEASKGLFCEPTNARAVGTPFKGVNYAEERLVVIRPGLEFLIRMKETGIRSNAWRHL